MDFLYDIPSQDLWSYLSSAQKPIVMYGMGNGADKILSVCQGRGITVCDFFASDGFVRGHFFHGKRVLSYSEVKGKYGTDGMIVLLAFGSSRPDVLELFRLVDRECELYAPDVPVCGTEVFDMAFFKANYSRITDARALLCDEHSRRIYDSVILYKLSGSLSYLFDAESSPDEVFSLISRSRTSPIRCCADLGAYNGDTLYEMLQEFSDVRKIYALEPDGRTYKKLAALCERYEGSAELLPINAAAWSVDTTLSFGAEGNRNSGIFAPSATAKTTNIVARSLDSILGGQSVDYIKYDVEGAEKEAIEGSRTAILEHRPALLVSAYHKSEDIFALPLLVSSLRPDYKMYYRRYPYVPAWDLNLICT